MAWPSEKESRYLGKGTTRIDGPAKVTGRAVFTSDVAPAGLLYGVILRSSWPAAHIRSVQLDGVRGARGIRAAVAVQDGPFDVYYYGQEIAAIAGVSRQAVEDALALVKIDAEPRTFVVKETAALPMNSPRVQPDEPNFGEGRAKETGAVDAAFAASAAVVEGNFETQVEIHHPMESHGHTIAWNDEGLTAWASTQAVFGVREGLAGALSLPQNKVRVICEHMGGGFGAKFGPGVEGVLCARLARAAGAPVKLMLTRREQSLAVGNRPSSFQRIKLGADAEGKLTAFELTSFGTAGFSTGVDSAGGSGGAGFPAPYLYTVPATRVKQGTVAINAGQACSMRAPGHPVASFGMESILDDLAAKLGLDPVAIRLKNDPHEIRRREYELGAERFGWKQKFHPPGQTPGPVKVGIGCAGAGWKSGGGGTEAELQVNSDGTVEVRVGTQDLGTGSRTVIRLVAAELLGLDREAVTVYIGDTRFPPSGASGGSMTTASVAPAVYDACEKAIAELKTRSGVEDPRGAAWREACKKLGRAPLQVRGRWREGLSSTGAGGVQFAEVEVDTDTGFVKIRRILAVQDCGTVINRLTCESQINGGVIMGIGYALYEQRIMDARTGFVLNPNFETYKLPGAADIPDIDVLLLDMPERGVIGVGEPCTIPTAAAIANAVANAIGVRVTSLPITPDKVLAALGYLPNGAAAFRAGARDFEQIAAAPSAPFIEDAHGCRA